MEYPDINYPSSTPNVEGDMPSRGRAARLVDGQGKAWMVDAEPAGHGTVFGDSCLGFRITREKIDDVDKVKIATGLLAGEAQDEIVVDAFTGDVWAHVVINSDGEITTVEIGHGGATPDDDATNFYYLIGYVDADVTVAPIQYVCGPINVSICRNWFSSPATYTPKWSPSYL